VFAIKCKDSFNYFKFGSVCRPTFSCFLFCFRAIRLVTTVWFFLLISGICTDLVRFGLLSYLKAYDEVLVSLLQAVNLIIAGLLGKSRTLDKAIVA